MKELLKYAACLVVNEKNRVEVSETEDPGLKKFVIAVAPGDIRNIIGREGKTIKAIRSLISMASINKSFKKKTAVEIVEQ